MKIFLVSSSLQNKPIYIGNQSERRWNVYKRSTTIEYVLVALQSEKDGTVGGSGESYKMPSKQLSGRRELTYIYIFNIYFFFILHTHWNAVWLTAVTWIFKWVGPSIDHQTASPVKKEFAIKLVSTFFFLCNKRCMRPDLLKGRKKKEETQLGAILLICSRSLFNNQRKKIDSKQHTIRERMQTRRYTHDVEWIC